MYTIQIYLKTSAPNTPYKYANSRHIKLNESDLGFEHSRKDNRIEQKISGVFNVTGDDFDTIFKYYIQPTPSNYYYNILELRFKIYKDENLIIDKRSGLTIKNINLRCKKATLEFKGLDYGGYGFIYDTWENVVNIKGLTTNFNETVEYTHNRSLSTTTTTETKTFDAEKVGSGDRYTTGQLSYISSKTNGNYALVKAEFAYNSHDCIANTITLDITYYWEKIVATGTNHYTFQNYKPSGINWYPSSTNVYDKPIPTFNVTEGVPIEASDCGLERDMYFYDSYEWIKEELNTLTYSTGITLENYLTALMPSISFDSSSFSALTSHPSIIIMGLSDIIPNQYGEVVSNMQEVLNVRLKDVLEWLNEKGFTWYLENITGIDYFRIIYTKYLTGSTTNPNLSNYKGRDWSLNNSWNVNEYPFTEITNGTQSSGGYFTKAEKYMLTPTTSKELTDMNVLSDVDYIIDAKTDAFDRANISTIVILDTTLSSSIYTIRKSTIVDVVTTTLNNYRFSAKYFIDNLICDMPIVYLAPTDINRLFKDKEVKIKIPIDDIFEDFNLYNTVEYQGFNCEIVSIKKEKGNTFAEMTLKVIWSD